MLNVGAHILHYTDFTSVIDEFANGTAAIRRHYALAKASKSDPRRSPRKPMILWRTMHPGGCSADASRGAFAPTYLPAEVEKQAEWILPVARGALNGSSVSSSPSSSLSRRRCFFAAKSDLHFQYNQFLPRDEYAIGRLWSTRNQNRDAYHHHDSYPPINPGTDTCQTPLCDNKQKGKYTKQWSD